MADSFNSVATTMSTTASNRIVPRKKIEKILIANRGEIACRIIRTSRRLGIQTVAVYSDADRHAMHVKMADEAYYIGPPAAQDSYLSPHKILSVAAKSSADAVHPGYGFLSENIEFCEFCNKEGLVFIGPPAFAIRDMGIKSTSKSIMSKAGVPIVRGYHGEDQSEAKLCLEAEKIGFPIMIKAVRGGGGKGMRIANTKSEFLSQLSSARRESLKAFGDDVVLLECYVQSPRHVEVQIFGDHHGNYVYLFERDCSIQRRHQKVIEEAPAPGVSVELRRKLGEAGVRAAKAVDYVGAGTVEFILDPATLNFHFMEMNTRLQVEHPVTEMITDTDLVEWQIKVASGEPLPMKQEDLYVHGHSFEARIYAENPNSDFLPGAGHLLHLVAPEPSEDVRIETGVCQGDEVSVHYDPMIAKLVVWADTREGALKKLHKKLSEYQIAGLDTNINFLMRLCLHPQLRLGKVHTGFIAEHRDWLLADDKVPESVITQAVIAVVLHEELVTITKALNSDDPFSPFATLTGFRVNHLFVRPMRLQCNGKDYEVEVTYEHSESYVVRIGKSPHRILVNGRLTRHTNGLELKCEMFDSMFTATVVILDDLHVHLFTKSGSYTFFLPDYHFQVSSMSKSKVKTEAVSPMPGIVDKMLVKPGDSVKEGDPLAVVIAMKMEHVIKSPKNGVVKAVLYRAGENVGKNVPLIQWQDQAV